MMGNAQSHGQPGPRVSAELKGENGLRLFSGFIGCEPGLTDAGAALPGDLQI